MAAGMTTRLSSSRHIALFLPALHSGGAERVMLNLAAELVARGHRVDLVLATAEGPYLDAIPAGVRLVDLGCRRTITAIVPLVGYLRRERPQALYAAIDHANVVALLANRLAGDPSRIVVSVHSPLSIGTGKNRLRGHLVTGLARRLYRRAGLIVTVSEGIRSDVVETLGLPPDKVRVIHNAVLTVDPASRGRAPLDPDLADLEHRPFIVSAGRLATSKDFPTLLRAFAMLDRGDDLSLVILGEGPERPALEALAEELDIADRVRFAGFRSNPFALFARARLFVLASTREGLPTVLIEAMATGCPIVSTDCPHGPREILADGRYGRLVPMRDPEAFATAIREAVASPTPPALLAERTRDFTTDRLVDRHLAALLGASAAEAVS
jgi:glycosyltransferase involved in cell wall biosynthesis